MWDSRLVFMLSSLVAIAAYFCYVKTLHINNKNFIYKCAIWIAIITVAPLVIVARAWMFGYEPTFPTLQSVTTALLGIIFGLPAAKFIRSLFGWHLSIKRSAASAIILVALMVAYSLPLYKDVIQDVMGNAGLLAVKTPLFELNFTGTQQGGALNTPSGAFSASYGVERRTDPTPGMRLLMTDLDPGESGIIDTDRKIIDYINNIYENDNSPTDDARTKHSNILLEETENFLAPIRTLSHCLDHYVNRFKDNYLLFVDTRPIIEALLMLHARIKDELNHKARKESGSNRIDYDLSGPYYKLSDSKKAYFTEKLNSVLRSVRIKFTKGAPIKTIEGCNDDVKLKDNVKIYLLQPYTTLVLSDILLARGAPDEAITVLAEWLDLWAKGGNVQSASVYAPEWFRYRVSARLALLLYNLAGINSASYQDFFKDYSRDFAEYIKRYANLELTRDLQKVCKGRRNINSSLSEDYQVCPEGDLQESVIRTPSSRGKSVNLSDNKVVEEKIIALLIGNENEYLSIFARNIAINPMVDKYGHLSELEKKADFLSKIDVECVGTSKTSLDERRAIVAEHKITAGLMKLAIADYKLTSVGVYGDRTASLKEARELRDWAKKKLEANSEVMREIVSNKSKKYLKCPLSIRIFRQSPWAQTLRNADRALSQLRRAEY
jgi:hypothetical protein